MRMGLGLGLGFTTNRTSAPTSVPDIICGAVHNRKEIGATVKSKALVLSPHVVYWKAGQPDVFWLDAVIVSEDGTPASKAKLGSFKLTDLSGVTALETTFEPFAGFKPDNPQYAGKTRCVL